MTCDPDGGWIVVRRGELAVACNLSGERRSVPLPAAPAAVLLSSSPGFAFGAGSIDTDGRSAVVLELV